MAKQAFYIFWQQSDFFIDNNRYSDLSVDIFNLLKNIMDVILIMNEPIFTQIFEESFLYEIRTLICENIDMPYVHNEFGFLEHTYNEISYSFEIMENNYGYMADELKKRIPTEMSSIIDEKNIYKIKFNESENQKQSIKSSKNDMETIAASSNKNCKEMEMNQEKEKEIILNESQNIENETYLQSKEVEPKLENKTTLFEKDKNIEIEPNEKKQETNQNKENEILLNEENKIEKKPDEFKLDDLKKETSVIISEEKHIIEKQNIKENIPKTQAESSKNEMQTSNSNFQKNSDFQKNKEKFPFQKIICLSDFTKFSFNYLDSFSIDVFKRSDQQIDSKKNYDYETDCVFPTIFDYLYSFYPDYHNLNSEKINEMCSILKEPKKVDEIWECQRKFMKDKIINIKNFYDQNKINIEDVYLLEKNNKKQDEQRLCELSKIY